jgi:hypothetical protein
MFIHFQYLYPFWTPKYNFLFRKCRRGICRVAKWIVNTYFLYQAVYVMWFTHKNNVRGLVGGNNNIFVMKERQVLSNIWVFIDVERVLIDPLSFFYSNLYERPQTLHPFTLLFTFCLLFGIILDGIHKYFKVMFRVYGFRLTIFRPFGKHVS